MEWSRSDVLSLARLSCSLCGGEGAKQEKGGRIIPCPCVLRAIFRACYARFRICVEKEKHMSRVSFEHFGGKERRLMWSRKDEEYAADFHLVSRRALDPFHYRLFSYHFLLGADWKLCCRQMGLDRGRFFHAVYRVQETLGQVFYELEPYALYPPREYFTTRLVRAEGPRAEGWFPSSATPGAGPASGSRGNSGGQAGGTRPVRSQGHWGPSREGHRSAPAFPRPAVFWPAPIAVGADCRVGA